MLALFICLLLASLVAGQPDVNSPNWRLAWADEFNGNSLDTTKWNARNMPGNGGNGELQWYSPSQVSVSGGYLQVTASKTTTNGYAYASGRLDSQDLAYFTYGRFVTSAKMAGGKGMWPAIWMLSETTCWPQGIEYDIVEYRGSYPTIYATNYHYSANKICCAPGVSNCVNYYGTSNSRYGTSQSARSLPDLSKGFHTYTMDIWPTNFTFYIDGYVIWTQQTGGSIPVSPTPHYWIINSAVGGGYPGNPDSTTVFPNVLQVDYVRVYEYRTACSANSCSGHGCCNTTSRVCKCNPGWTGTSCESWVGQAYHNFAVLSSLELCLNGGQNDYSTVLTSLCSVSNNLVTLAVSNSGCPSACGNKPYGTGAWQSQSMYPYGSFSWVAKGGGVSGTAFNLQAAGNYGGMQQMLYFAFLGSNKNQVQLWSFANNYQFQYTTLNLAFDWSAAFHNYTVVWSSTQTNWYIDGSLLWTDARNIPFGELTLGAAFTVEPDWYGPFTYPSSGAMYSYLSSSAWSTSGGAPATC